MKAIKKEGSESIEKPGRENVICKAITVPILCVHPTMANIQVLKFRCILRRLLYAHRTKEPYNLH
jgi:hypothetical protein